jgi:hypothetical protein
LPGHDMDKHRLEAMMAEGHGATMSCSCAEI